MSYSSDREDSVSMALSVTQLLLEKYGVLPEEVGHVQVRREGEGGSQASTPGGAVRQETQSGRGSECAVLHSDVTE